MLYTPMSCATPVQVVFRIIHLVSLVSAHPFAENTICPSTALGCRGRPRAMVLQPVARAIFEGGTVNSTRSRIPLCLFSTLAVAVVFQTALFGQVDQGAITGTVTHHTKSQE